MATFKPQTIENHADFLSVKAFLVTIGCAAAGLLVFLIFNTAMHEVVNVEAVLSLGRMKPDAAKFAWAQEFWFVIWLIAGIFIGSTMAAKYRFQAQMLLCTLEQEKHLRFIAASIAAANEQQQRNPVVREAGHRR